MCLMFMQFLLAVYVFINSVYPLTLTTGDVIFQQSDSIILNCTYHTDSTDCISDRDIRWQKQIGYEFKDIAVFSPPGGVGPFIDMEMEPLYINRIELIAPNTLLSAVMIIKHPLCSDQGVYQCRIDNFFNGYSLETQTSRSIVVFKAKASEPETFLLFPSELEENHSINLICKANVGSPQGTIKIWKLFKNNTSELVYVSNTTTNKTENCTEFLNVNATYTVTRDDNGAVFRCSSQNNFIQGQGPHRDSSKITVIYGPDKSAVILTPSKSMYVVGDALAMQCIADSNPPSVFDWSFRPYNTSKETLVEHVHFNSKLDFDNLQTTDSGTYICTAINTARPNYPKTSSSVSLYVRHSDSNYNGCKKCGYLQTCQQHNRDTVCVINVWAAIAVVFIITFLSFAVTTILLIVNKKNRSTCITSSNRVHSQGVPQNDTGYQTHADFANTHVYSSLQSHKPETGEYTSLQSKKPETAEYTSLQSQKPETNEYTSLQSQKPETGEYTLLHAKKPETGEYTSLQSHNPDIGEYTPLQFQKPKTGEHILLQTKKPDTGDHTSLPSHTPETSEYTSLQSHKQETAEYTSLQSHKQETAEYTSLQSHKQETAEYTSLQSHKPETGEYTTIDNVS